MTSMSAASAQLVSNCGGKIRGFAQGSDTTVLTEIYQDHINIVALQRILSNSLQQSIGQFTHTNPDFNRLLTVSPDSALSDISNLLGASEYHQLAEDMTELVDMYCCLFDLEHVGLRLTVLDRAMCPKFHVDGVACRLVCTYQGTATQWLFHEAVDRSKLGRGSLGLTDDESGLYQCDSDINQLQCGDVALLKGESWPNNKGFGLVHRSPALQQGERRLLLTLDFAE
jgi:hypothetical protein